MIDALLSAVASNVAVAAGIAILALAVTRFSQRPALAHALWVLVLLKLVTPPIVRLPLASPSVTEIAVARIEPAAAPRVALASASSSPLVPAAPIARPTPAIAGREPNTPRPIDWRDALFVLWGVGSLGLVARTAFRAARFRRLLRRAPAASATIRARAAALSRRLGLRATPRIVLLDGRLPPMLWALGRPTIALPRSLVERFAPTELDVVLAHELAHLRRGDHRVRWLEVACVVAFWWLPLVWWARRALRRVEEECCDAWVVWAEPEHGEVYARALVKTLAFLSGDRLPSLACGVRHLGPMKRRLTMILERTPPRRLSTAGRTAAIALAATLLTFAPTIAQDEHAAERERLAKQIAHVDRAIRELKMAELPAAIESLVATRTRLVARAKSIGARIVPGEAKVRALENEVERLDEEVLRLEAKLRNARDTSSEELAAAKVVFDRLRTERNAAAERLSEAVDGDRLVDVRHGLETIELDFRGLGEPHAAHDRSARNAKAIAELKAMIARLCEQNARLERRMADLVPKGAETRPESRAEPARTGWRPAAADQLAQLHTHQAQAQYVLRDTLRRLHDAEEAGKRQQADEYRRAIADLKEQIHSIERRIYELRAAEERRTKGGRAK